MKPLLFLCLLLAFAAPCTAQSASGPFADVRLGTWPYAAVATLEKAGIVIGYMDGTYGGRRVMTRYEFASASARLIAQISDKAAAHPQTDCDKHLWRSPLAVNAGLALLNDFRPELEKLKQDVPKAQSILLAMQNQQRQEIYLGKIVLMPEQLQSPFAELSYRDPAWRYADRVEKTGVVVGAMDGTGDLLPVTRLNMAISLARLFTPSVFSGVTNRLQHEPQAAPVLSVLLTEFTPELNLLGQNANNYLVPIAEREKTQAVPLAAQPFADVPAEHWAASSVESLRLHGLVAGYGDGKFTLLGFNAPTLA